MLARMKSGRREAELVDFLRDCAATLPDGASELRRVITRYAAAIEESSSTKQALAEFYRFAHHYKGLRDVPVPGISEQEWRATVTKARRLSSAASLAYGLDRSLIGRFHAWLRRRGGP